ncbi:ABC transporter permease subunit [Leucobacter sp. CSA1]|uniref:ABC transporter permease subunit n=1 Tax=Leucobacter chromiisoli TaxID=2796471 RepID=A0A934Q5Q4_9MICO|nr:ABC transporter permease subunit [Leucobacter chromiisoli]MBK0418799.1 ABC transporter permease subunit [Leucobacter chromiisoli]
MLSDLWHFLPGFLQGLWVTVWVGLASILTMLVTGVALFLLLRTQHRVVGGAIAFLIEFLRSGSAVVGVFWVFYALPLFIPGAELSGAVSALIVLGISGGAYASEILRGAAKGIPVQQLDACAVLNMGFWTREGRIVLPQVITSALPSLSALSVEVFKWTAVVSLVAVPDFLYWIGVARAQTGHTAMLYVIAVIVYFLLGRGVAAGYRLIGRSLGLGVAEPPRRSRGAREARLARAAMPVNVTAGGGYAHV